MVTIVLYPLLSNSALYEHRCMVNINKSYKSSGTCDDKQQYKSILEAFMVSIPEEITNNSPLSPGPYLTVKNTSVSKSLCRFSENLDVKKILLSEC